MAKKKRDTPEINASSMADIAFLLLIFFLVTTTIEVDKGILHKLPRWTEEPPPDIKQNKRNTMVVLINSRDQLLVNDNVASVDNLREKAKEFLDNKGRDPKMSESPTKAVISLQNDRGTSYGVYLGVQNELKAAYRELRDDYAMNKYNKTYAQLRSEYNKLNDNIYATEANKEAAKAKLKDITDAYPMRLSEAEPKEVGGN